MIQSSSRYAKITIRTVVCPAILGVGHHKNCADGGSMTKEAVFIEERFPNISKPRILFTLLGNVLGMLRYMILGP